MSTRISSGVDDWLVSKLLFITVQTGFKVNACCVLRVPKKHVCMHYHCNKRVYTQCICECV